MPDSFGTVYLVGAGPGDPGLLTVRGLELLRLADVVVYDQLLGDDMLAEARSDAELIPTGKSPCYGHLFQERIDALLIDRARRGLTVVRLKSGDPFVFGRGYEEMTACRDAGVNCVVVPGVTSAVAAPEMAGIPITERRSVRSLAIVSARPVGDSTAAPLDHGALARIDTVVIMMGRPGLDDLARSLIEAGRSGSTPAACIEWGATSKQRVLATNLQRIAERADRHDSDAPVIVVVGEVAAEAGRAQ